MLSVGFFLFRAGATALYGKNKALEDGGFGFTIGLGKKRGGVNEPIKCFTACLLAVESFIQGEIVEYKRKRITVGFFDTDHIGQFC